MNMSVEYGEVEYIEIETPPCWGYVDPKDLSCAKCPIKEYCMDEQAETRPECFGKLRNESNEECSRCLDESMCAETIYQGDKEMTKTTVRRKRRPVRRKDPTGDATEPVVQKPATHRKEKPAPVNAKPVATADSEYDEWEQSELRDELKERGLSSRGRKAQLIKRLIDDDNAEEGEVEPEPAPEKPTRRRKAKEVEVEEVEDDEADDGVGLSIDGSMTEFIESVGVGQSVVATRIDEDTWSFVIVAGGMSSVAKPAGMGLKGDAYWEEVCSEEYWNFYYTDCGNGKPWDSMTSDEKFEYADGIGVTWEEHDHERVNSMRCVKAIFKELGIVKYKPEYSTKAARDSVR